MKHSIKLLNRLTTVLLMALCLLAIAIPTVATDTATVPEDIRYGIVIECSYSDIEDSNTVDRSIYEENVFRLTSKTTGLYAVADYSAKNQTYAITGYTADEDAAARFRCGADAKLRISGIAPDSYILDQVQTAAGYMIIFGTEVDFSTDTPMVNDCKIDTSIAPDTGEVIASLSIQQAKGFDIPMGACDLACWSYRTFGFDISGLLTIVGCVLIIGCSIALIVILICQRKEKKSEESQIGR